MYLLLSSCVGFYFLSNITEQKLLRAGAPGRKLNNEIIPPPSLPKKNESKSTSNDTTSSNSSETVTKLEEKEGCPDLVHLSLVSNLPPHKGPLSNHTGIQGRQRLSTANEKRLKALEEKCKSLEEEILKKDRDLIAAQQERNLARKEAKDALSEHEAVLERTKTTLQAEFRDRYEKLRTTKGTAEELQKVTEGKAKLQEAMDKLRAKDKDSRAAIHELKEAHKSRENFLEGQVMDFKVKLATANFRIDTLVPQYGCNRSSNEVAESKEKLVNALLEMNDLMPLVKIGRDIRIRYLEKEGRADTGIELDTANSQSHIQKGNEAAHHANQMADAALFWNNFLTLEDPLGKVYTGLYGSHPTT